MKQKIYYSYNPYFFIPLAIWAIFGAFVLSLSDKETLFRIINGNNSEWLDYLMRGATLLGEGVFITVVLLLLLGYKRLRNWWYFILALSAVLLPSIVTQVFKSIFSADRPLKFFHEADWIHISPDWPRLMERSFPSGHSCGAFSMFCLLSVLLPFRFRKFGIVFFFLALMVGYSRIYLAAHFFEDVYAGSLLGVLFVVFAVIIMTRFQHIFMRAEKQV
ncbi:hypothetical protein CAP35_09180 [Chitinophagaceae bacterium IBVUCB1]|nr:hypothetical protein CAP35_09180 [Chitinophagaceae bacterium IBVUCB1]